MERAFNGRANHKNPCPCDTLGDPTGFHLMSGQAHDLEGTDALLPEILETIQTFLAAQAYAAHKRVLDLLVKSGVKTVIPPTANRRNQRQYDKDR